MTDDTITSAEVRKAARATATAARRVKRATDHARYKAEAKARRDAERTRRAAERAARNASWYERLAARVEANRVQVAAAHYRGLARRAFPSHRQVDAVPLTTEDGFAFVSVEVGVGPFGPSLFALQDAEGGSEKVVVDSATGVVVARGRSDLMALRALSKVLTPRHRSGRKSRVAA